MIDPYAVPEDRVVVPRAPEPLGRTSRVGLCLSMGLYVASFLAPYHDRTRGGEIFLSGLLYCWMVPITTAWWANPIFWWAYVLGCRGQWRLSAFLGLCAGLLACLHLWLGPPGPIGPAFYLWAGSMAVLSCFALASEVVGDSRRSPRTWPPNKRVPDL